MGLFNVTVGAREFLVENILTLETDCSTIFEYEVTANNGDEITITFNGDHELETIIDNGIQSTFNDAIVVTYNNSLIIRTILTNSGQSGVFNDANLDVSNNNSGLGYSFKLERQNDSPNCDDLGNPNIPENLTWQHASSTSGGSSDVTQNLIPGEATEFTSIIVHNAAIMAPEIVTNTIKNKGFAGLDIGGNGASGSVFAVRIKGNNPNNGNVEIGDPNNDINTWNPASEGRKNTVSLKRSFRPTVGATLTSAGDFQFTGAYANNPIDFDTYGEDPNSYYAAFESNPIIGGVHLAANPDKIFALRGKGRLRLTDYGSGNVNGIPLYNIVVDNTGKFIERSLNRNNFTKISSAYTIVNTDYYVEVTASTFSINLPSATGIEGQKHVIKNSGAGVITIDGNGSETIDGNLTATLNQNNSISIVSNGSNWITI